jgi:hypothetical protein
VKLPWHLIFSSSEYAPDGGSTYLCVTDEHDREHRVYLPRNIYSDGGGIAAGAGRQGARAPIGRARAVLDFTG